MCESSDLAMIGDRRTCALLNKQGNIVWYCPRRFDNPSLFARLIDSEKGGSWNMEVEGLEFDRRTYLEDSGLLRTCFTAEKGELQLEDWMPLDAPFYGICRKLSSSPVPYSMELHPGPDYARRSPVLEKKGSGHAALEYDFHLYASHALDVGNESVTCHIPAGEEAWF
ncbi:MAG: trehalase-like domain-containing protein, partial [Balneolales bacterium]